MTKPELQKALDESLNFCSEYRKIIENQSRKLAGKEEEIRQLEAMLLERDQQLKRFSPHGCLNDLGVAARNHVVGFNRVDIGAGRDFQLMKAWAVV
jgi:hypothetical protein